MIDPSAAPLQLELERRGLAPVSADNALTQGVILLSDLFATKAMTIGADCPYTVRELRTYAWGPRAAEAGEGQAHQVPPA